MTWPDYPEWIASLSPSDAERARALTERFRSLGARDPEGWARSEVAEGIAQLGRFVLLDAVRRKAIDYWNLTGVLDDAAAEDPVFQTFLRQLRQAGLTDRQMGRLAQKIAAVTAREIMHILDAGSDPERDGPLPGWVVGETDLAGRPTGRDLGGLHESFLEFDPTRPEK